MSEQSISHGEVWKTRLCFGLFGVVLLVLFGRLAWLQGFRAVDNRRSVDRAQTLRDPLPTARGTILDRHGRPLAYDRPVMVVRGEFQARVPKGIRRIPLEVLDLLATRLAAHVSAGREDGPARAELRRALLNRMHRAPHRLLPSNHKTRDFLQVDFLVAGALDAHDAVRRLRAEVERWRTDRSLPGRLHLRFIDELSRTYPDREFTLGPIGNFFIAAQKKVRRGKRVDLQSIEGFTGLEACRGLWPCDAAGQADFCEIEFKDSRRRRYWTGIGKRPESPSALATSIDLDLQKLAHAELRSAAAAVEAHYRSSYQWGTMVLVDVASGGILAMASHYPGRKGAAPNAAVESSFEPGSVVKPLVIALALENGKVSPDEQIDCTPTRPGRGRPVSGFPERVIYDDHACGPLDIHGILINSSNIGAVSVGTRLGRTGLKDYLVRYGFCTRTRLGLPGEVPGARPGGIAGIDKLSETQLGRYTAPSLSFGYELNVTAAQLARAYLSMLSGVRRELHLVRTISRAGKSVEWVEPRGARFLSDHTVARIRAAMVDVVSDKAEQATGRHLFTMLRKLGYDYGLIGGKTGTADSPIGGVRHKTAAFVGFAPADRPRYLVVCVLRKLAAARFYGGSYAAQPAGRLLLGALALEKADRSVRDEVVSARLECAPVEQLPPMLAAQRPAPRVAPEPGGGFRTMTSGGSNQ